MHLVDRGSKRDFRIAHSAAGVTTGNGGDGGFKKRGRRIGMGGWTERWRRRRSEAGVGGGKRVETDQGSGFGWGPSSEPVAKGLGGGYVPLSAEISLARGPSLISLSAYR
ncbi:hypothetical protein LX36DRAFT_34004 [Colletotrichum falcatum]|nr:hypothetical protein LX36DRAFT_34004 [Colletotrichum falcatum]